MSSFQVQVFDFKVKVRNKAGRMPDKPRDSRTLGALTLRKPPKRVKRARDQLGSPNRSLKQPTPAPTQP